DRKRGVQSRSRLGAAHRVVEQRQVAEEGTRSELDELAVDGPALRPDQDAAFDDDVDGLPLVALVEDHFVLQELALVEQAVDDFQLARRQVHEQRQGAQALHARRVRLLLEQTKHRRYLPYRVKLPMLFSPLPAPPSN